MVADLCEWCEFDPEDVTGGHDSPLWEMYVENHLEYRDLNLEQVQKYAQDESGLPKLVRTTMSGLMKG